MAETAKEPAIDPDDAPEWTDEIFDRAEFRIGDKVIRPASGTLTKAGRRPRGRPKSETPKRLVTLRLDADVVATYRRTGRGWQTRINDALRKAMGEG